MPDPTRRLFIQTATAGALSTASLASPATESRPNILLLFPDQFRYDWTQANRTLPVRTPNIARLATNGMSFSKAIVASPLCAPSRACLASGKSYPRCRVAGNGHDYPIDQRTHYSLLRDAGYHVVACGKVDLHKATLDWGLDGKRLLKEWGFSDGIDNAGKYDAISSGAEAPKDPYMAYLYGRDLAAAHIADFRRRIKDGYAGTYPTPLPDPAYCDNWIGNNGLQLLTQSPKDRPWYLSVNFTGPHNPEDITASMEARARGREFPQPNGCKIYTPEIHTAIRQNYSAMVENIDRWVGVYVDELRKRGELDRTLIVFSSDHGEMLGDHNRWGKSVPWQASVGVPLVVSGPGVKRRVVNAPVSTLDLTSTFLDYAGIQTPADMDSRSMRPMFTGEKDRHREIVTSALGPWKMAWDGRYKLMHGYDPAARMSGEGKQLDPVDPSAIQPLLFDHETDPQENRNIHSEQAAIARKLANAWN